MADRFLRRFLPFSENHLPGLLYKRKPAYELFFRNMPEHGIVHARFQVSAPLVRRQFISYQNQVNIPAGFPKALIADKSLSIVVFSQRTTISLFESPDPTCCRELLPSAASRNEYPSAISRKYSFNTESGRQKADRTLYSFSMIFRILIFNSMGLNGLTI